MLAIGASGRIGAFPHLLEETKYYSDPKKVRAITEALCVFLQSRFYTEPEAASSGSAASAMKKGLAECSRSFMGDEKLTPLLDLSRCT
jgi:hypothetical protein